MATTTPERVQLDRYFYRVLKVKRSSPFAQVWLLGRTTDTATRSIYDKNRAAKTFDKADEAAVVNELANWILLSHKNILPFIKIARLNFRIAALMELCKGTLQDVLNERRLTWSETHAVLRQVGAALQYAYMEHNLVHLDIKPSNILIKNFPSLVQVSDWGISQLADKGGIDGGGFTPGYLAPERLSGKPVPGPSSDIFGLGMVAVNALTGTLPYAYNANEALYGSVAEQQFRQLHSSMYYKHAEHLLKRFPAPVQKLVLSCIHPDPAVRHSDYDRLLHAIAQVAA